MKHTLSSRLITKILMALGVLYLLFHMLFLWMYTNIDGYFYWAIGQYFKTGIYPFIAPFLYSKPTTISPPLYGLFLSIIGSLPRDDIFLHAIHLMLMATTAFLLFRILSKIISANNSAFISFLFLIFPTNVIYTSSMMTELPAQTAMTAYLFLAARFLKTQSIAPLAYALLLSAVMTLLKYQFIILFIFTGIALFWKLKQYTGPKRFPVFSAIIGTIIILLWVSTNHSITGVWGLSDTKKMPFYTNFVWNGRYYPKESDPSVIALRAFVPSTADRYGEYWDLQDYILPYTNRDWRMVDELLGNVGIAAIYEHPMEYLFNGIRIFFQTLTHRAPWWQNVQTFGKIDPIQPLYCDRLKTIQFCQPIIKTAASYSLWNAYVSKSRTLYDTFMPSIFLFLFLPSLIITLVDKRWNVRIYSIMYLINLVPISYLSMIESRYLIPYYPLMIIITVYGVKKIQATVSQYYLSKPPIKK